MKKTLSLLTFTFISLSLFAQDFRSLMDQGRSLRNNRPEEAIRRFISAGLVDRNSVSNWEQVLAELDRTYPIIQQTRTDLGTRTDERDRARADLRARTTERDTARSHLQTRTTERDDARAELNTTRQTLDTLTQERDQARTELSATQQNLSVVTAERDRLLGAGPGAGTGTDNCERQLDQVRRELNTCNRDLTVANRRIRELEGGQGHAPERNITFGIRGGLSLSSMMPVGEKTSLNDGFDMLMAPNFGIFTEFQVNRTISFRLGVEYSRFGGARDGIQAFSTSRLLSDITANIGLGTTEEHIIGMGILTTFLPQYYYADVNTTVKFDYIKVPLLAQFGANIGQSPWRVYANVGPFVSFLLSANQVSSGTSRLYTNALREQTLWSAVEGANAVISGSTDMLIAEFPNIKSKLDELVTFGTTEITNEMRSAYFGVSGNLGIRYQHNRHNFFLEVGGNYGFTAVQQNSNNGGNRLGALSVALGYSFSLNGN